jgi:hypothetical protein
VRSRPPSGRSATGRDAASRRPSPSPLVRPSHAPVATVVARSPTRALAPPLASVG